MQEIVLFPRLSEFLGYFQAIRERSQLTIREYRYDLTLFFRFLLHQRGLAPRGQEIDQIDISGVDDAFLRTVTLTDFYAFLTWLARERRCGPAARARKVSALRSFFKYLKGKAMVLTTDPAIELESPKPVRQLPRHLSLDESRALLETVANKDTRTATRDTCILTFFLNCGLRLSELVGINVDDIREDTLTVLGKGAKERTVYLNGACLEALENWLEDRPGFKPRQQKALFISRPGTRISTKAVQVIVKRELAAAGIDSRRYSVHKLRHTAATLMYQYGKVDIRALQQILGHTSIATTEIYTHINAEALHQAVESNPLNQVRPGRKRSPKSGV